MASFCRNAAGVLLAIGIVTTLLAQQPVKSPAKAPGKSLQAQSTSSINYSPAPDGSQTVEIRNITFDFTSTGLPGRPTSERLLLRKTIHSKETVDDIGTEATVTLEAWPLGVDLKQKPVYTINQTGTDGQVVNGDMFLVDRRLEEVEWWSLHKLGTGERLFDTYVPLVSFSPTREILNTRYVGLEVPPDDANDARLREPHVVGVLSYASPDRLMREALITCDDPKLAQLLRSYADSNRALSQIEGARGPGKGKASDPSHTIRLAISQNYPSPPATVEVRIPILNDDLDLAHAQLPPRFHIVAWKR